MDSNSDMAVEASPAESCLQMWYLQKLNSFRRSNLLCDGIIRTTDGGVFHVHRPVLAASSAYFSTMFTTTLHSQEVSDVMVHLVRAEILQKLIDFCYLHHVAITPAIVQELLVAADYLCFLDVVDLCCDILESTLSPHNCLGIMLLARCYFCRKLEQTARRFTLRHFEAVAAISEELLCLELGVLRELLAEEQLHARSEEAPWGAALRWLQHDLPGRRPHIAALMGAIRLGQMDPMVFIEKVKNHPFVYEDDTATSLVIRTLQFMVDLKNISLFAGTAPMPRLARPRVPHDVLFAIGGLKGETYTDFMETYDTRADRWTKVEDMEQAPQRVYHGAAVLGYCIYVIGGKDGNEYTNSCWCFDAVNKLWKEVSPMNTWRSGVSVVELRGALYALGGCDGSRYLRTVERYWPPTNQWTMVAPMHIRRSQASACTLGDKIYIAGGFTGARSSPTAEVYDPGTDSWTRISRMQFVRKGLCCVAYHNKIYALGGHDGTSPMASCEVYSPSSSSWAPVAPMQRSRSNFAAAVIDDLIVAMGNDTDTDTRHVECYDDRTNVWYKATDLLQARSGLSASVVKGLPNVQDYVYKCRGGAVEEKRLLMSATTQHPQPAAQSSIRNFLDGEVDEDDNF